MVRFSGILTQPAVRWPRTRLQRFPHSRSRTSASSFLPARVAPTTLPKSKMVTVFLSRKLSSSTFSCATVLRVKCWRIFYVMLRMWHRKYLILLTAGFRDVWHNELLLLKVLKVNSRAAFLSAILNAITLEILTTGERSWKR